MTDSLEKQATVTRILDQMSVIALDCSIWSGARRLKPEDLVLGKGGKLPSDEVVSPGSKKLCKREVLKPFHRLRDQACRLCGREGVRFLGGYAQTLFEQTFRGKNKVTRKALNPILRLRDKLHGLAFVDPGIIPVVQRLDAGLAQLPNNGALEGEVLTQLMERVLLLCSVEQIERCAQGLTALDTPHKEQPVMMQDQGAVQLPVVNDTELQEQPVIEQSGVVGEETNSTATFYF